MTTDPYAPPTTPLATSPDRVEARPCPFCSAEAAKKISVTWWGGLLGPRLFSVVRCLECGRSFNGKKGTSLTAVIVTYQLVATAIVAGLLWVLWIA